MAAIVTEGLRKEFDGFVAVKDVSLRVEEGENFALLGPNGAGKSTFIRMLTTLLTPSAGTARVAGHDLRTEPDTIRRKIGVVPQPITSDLKLTAAENLHFYAKLYRVPGATRRRIVPELLKWIGLFEWRDKYVGTFSIGMRRRLEIARCLVHEPELIFLDEPTTGLDPAARISMWEMIDRVKSERTVTVFLTTHYMEEADALSDRIAIFDHGAVVAEGTPEQLKSGLPSRRGHRSSLRSRARRMVRDAEGAPGGHGYQRRRRTLSHPQPRAVSFAPGDRGKGSHRGRRHLGAVVTREYDGRRVPPPHRSGDPRRSRQIPNR